MIVSRRFAFAALAAAASPVEAWSARAPKGCHGRAAYAGGPLHAQIAPEVFDQAAAAGAKTVAPFASDELDYRLARALKANPAVQTLTAAVARKDGALSNQSVAAVQAAVDPAQFQWPGLGEVFLVTLALQLVEAGKLDLGSTVDRWAPELPTARGITLDDLLSHTAGLTGSADLYCPGAGWSADAADARLLARIVEVLEGRPYAEVARLRIVEALGLKETRLAASATGEALLVTASASDVVRFWRALMANRLHNAALTRRRYYRLYPTTASPARTFYGLGVGVTDLVSDPWNPADLWLGHTGVNSMGAAVVTYSQRKQAFVAVALTGQGDPDEVVDLLLDGIDPPPPRPLPHYAPRTPHRRRRRSPSTPALRP